MMREVCFDVQTEPMLKPLASGEMMSRRTNTSDHARLDISGRGVWSPSDRAFFDVRVSHPNTLSNRGKTLKQIYSYNEQEKKAEYEERVINVERATFTPLVFLTSGGMSNDCKTFNDRLAQKIAKKKKDSYPDVVRYVRTRLRFAMLRATLISIRGYRGERERDIAEIGQVSFNLIPQVAMVE